MNNTNKVWWQFRTFTIAIAFMLLLTMSIAGEVTGDKIKIKTDKDYYSCSFGQCEIMNLEVKKMSSIDEPISIEIIQHSTNGAITNVKTFLKEENKFKKNGINLVDNVVYDIQWTAFGSGKFDIAVVGNNTGTVYAVLDPWWSSDYNQCRNLTITDTYAVTNRLVWDDDARTGLNLTGLDGKQADNDDIRIINAGCGDGGDEVAYDVETSGSNWAAVYFLANTTAGNTTYSVYYNYSSATAPDYSSYFNLSDNTVGNRHNISNAYQNTEIELGDLEDIYHEDSGWTQVGHDTGTCANLEFIPMQCSDGESNTIVLDGNVVKIVNVYDSTPAVNRSYIKPAENKHVIQVNYAVTDVVDGRVSQMITANGWTANDTGFYAYQDLAYMFAYSTAHSLPSFDYAPSGNWLILKTTNAGTSRSFVQYLATNSSGVDWAEVDYFSKVYNSTALNVTIGDEQTNEIATNVTVVLVSPTNETEDNNVTSTSFVFNASLTGAGSVDWQNCSVWTNESGSWNFTLANSSAVVNISNNTVVFSHGGVNATWIWNVQCFADDGNSSWGSANWTYTTNYSAGVLSGVCPSQSSAPSDYTIYDSQASSSCCVNDTYIRYVWYVGNETYTKDVVAMHGCVNITSSVGFGAEDNPEWIKWFLVMAIVSAFGIVGFGYLIRS